MKRKYSHDSFPFPLLFQDLQISLLLLAEMHHPATLVLSNNPQERTFLTLPWQAATTTAVELATILAPAIMALGLCSLQRCKFYLNQPPLQEKCLQLEYSPGMLSYRLGLASRSMQPQLGHSNVRQKVASLVMGCPEEQWHMVARSLRSRALNRTVGRTLFLGNWGIAKDLWLPQRLSQSG